MEFSGKSDYAILKDRTLMENGLAQMYGTQIWMAATVIGGRILLCSCIYGL